MADKSQIVRNLTGEPTPLFFKHQGVTHSTTIFAGLVPLPQDAEVIGDLPPHLRLEVIDPQPLPVVDDQENLPLEEDKPQATDKKGSK